MKKFEEGKRKGYPDGNQMFEKSKLVLSLLNENGATDEMLQNVSLGGKVKHLTGNLEGTIQTYPKHKNPGLRLRLKRDELPGKLYNVEIDDFHDKN